MNGNQTAQPIPEKVPAPEQGNVAPEKATEKPTSFEQVVPAQKPKAQPSQPVVLSDVNVPNITSQQKSSVDIKQIEQVLSRDLEDVYFQMDQQTQEQFKQAGEEASRKIQILLDETKVNIKKIFLAIMDWLKVIPGINKFFLEQESKIKADEMVKLKK